MARRIIRTVVVAALLAGCGFAEKLEVDLAVEKVVKDRLESGVVGPRQRQGAIRSLFSDAGCSAEEQRVDKNAANVVCTLPGETASTIVIGGHYDFADRGKGMVDDWSGASLLPSHYDALKSRPRKHTYVFVAFAREEEGLLGSSKYVKNLTSEQKMLIRAFVNLECLGLTPAKVWVHRASPVLLARLNEVARAVDVTLQGVNVDQAGDDDTHPFSLAHIPVITIHSVTQETWGILHSDRDQVEAIHFDDYYTAYKLTAYYLAYLDVKTE